MKSSRYIAEQKIIKDLKRKDKEFEKTIENEYTLLSATLTMILIAKIAQWESNSTLSFSDFKQKGTPSDIEDAKIIVMSAIEQINTRFGHEKIQNIRKFKAKTRIDILRSLIETEIIKTIDKLTGDITNRLTQEAQDEINRQKTALNDIKPYLTKKDLDNIVNNPLYGATYIDRISAHLDTLINLVNNQILKSIIGQSKVSILCDKINNILSTSNSGIKNLAITESSRVQSETQKAIADALKIEYGIYVTENDNKVCSICHASAGTVINLRDGVIGIDLPPKHPMCRCSVLLNTEYQDILDTI